VRADAGRLLVDGQARAADNDFKSRIGYLPESVAFSDNLTGAQVMRFFARARRVGRARQEEVLRRVGLEAAARRQVRGYSRGMRQRLGLGIAILAEPELLLLDEPTGGLDQQGLRVLQEVIVEWHRAGRMVLAATHDLALLEARLDRVCVLKAGRVLADDTPDGLRKLASLPVEVTFSLDGDPERVASLLARLTAWEGCRVEPRAANGVRVHVAPDRLLELVEMPAAFGGAVTGVRVREPSMDDVYQHLIMGGDAPGAVA